MNILFLDQSGKPGGAELYLLDIAKAYGDRSLVALFESGSFYDLLQNAGIPVQVLSQPPLKVRKNSHFVQGIRSLGNLIPLISEVTQLSRHYDLIYANTQKALVAGAIASGLSGCPLVYHLHDILSAEHFSPSNRRLAVTLANRFASLVLANSQATQAAFVSAGGHPELVRCLYNGFDLNHYRSPAQTPGQLRQQLGVSDRFVVGHFSRLSPWKGQHILLEALSHCPENITVLLVGAALFGEDDYAQQLRQQVRDRGLEQRVQFLGFQKDVVSLMSACDLVVHSSTAPEPFGRVIVEAMLCGRPVLAAEAGGAVELIRSGATGWLVPPNHPVQLAEAIAHCYHHPEQTQAIAQRAQLHARQHFDLSRITQQLDTLLQPIAKRQRAYSWS